MQGSFGEFIGKKVYLLRILHEWESLSTKILSFAHQFPCVPFLPSLQVWRVDGPSRSGTYRWSRKVRASKPYTISNRLCFYTPTVSSSENYLKGAKLQRFYFSAFAWSLSCCRFSIVPLSATALNVTFHLVCHHSLLLCVLLKERLWRLWKGWAIVWILNLTNISHILWYTSSESRDPSEFQGFIRELKSVHWSFVD